VAGLEIRLGHTARGFAVAWFGLCGLLLLLMLVAAALHGAGWAALGVAVFGAAVAGVVWRWTNMSVVGEPDQLVVRNFFGTRRIPRNVIEDFRLGGSNWESPGVAIRVVLRDRTTVVLTATGRYFASPADHDVRLAQLKEWRHRPA
jgi:hypothetical protein